MENRGKIKPISYVLASEYIKNLVEEGILESFDQVIGGVFEAKKLKKWSRKKKFPGLMFWYCLDPETKKPFISIERVKNKFKYEQDGDTRNLPGDEMGRGRKCRLSKNFNHMRFINKNGESLKNEILEFLITDSGKPSDTFERKSFAETAELVNEFRNEKSYHQSGFAYFTFSEDTPPEGQDPTTYRKFISEFFDQGENVKYIRYYFGYEPSYSKDNLRLILVPVDKEGRNFLPKDKQGLISEDGPVLLQYSWPPRNP
ncbi:MAG: hypothetical protein ACQEW9_02230 [Bacteroidota bacterium]